MNGCDVLFDAETAERVRREVSRQMGGVCPCDEGRTCPLLPEGFSQDLIQVPTVRRDR